MARMVKNATDKEIRLLHCLRWMQLGGKTVGNVNNVAPLLMMGGPPPPSPPEQLPFLINAAASPKFAAQLKSYGTLESI